MRTRPALLIVAAALLVVAAGSVLVLGSRGVPGTAPAAATSAGTSQSDRSVSTETPPPGYPEEWALDPRLQHWSDDPPLPDAHGGIGDTVTFTDSLGGTGTITLNGIRRTTQKAADSRFAPDPQWSYVIFDLTFTSTDGFVSPSPTKLRVQSDQGWHGVNPVPTPVMLGLTFLDTGQSTRGLLGFDAPPGQLRLDYNDQNGPVASFVVNG